MARDTLTVPLRPNILTAVDDFLPQQNAKTGRPTRSRGVFSAYPFMSPKYARHRPNRRHEYDQTMARMFIKVAPDLYDKFVASLEDEDTKKVARVIAGDDVNKGGHGYIDFLLQRAVHELNEKMQVVETLSDNYVAFFFGHAPPVFQYQGTLYNTYQDDWTMRMFRIFKSLGRGTALARQNLVMRLRYDSMIVSGAMTNFSWQTIAGQETYCPFTFSFLVSGIQTVYGNVAPPTRFEKEERFTPEGTQLEETGVGDVQATQTKIDTQPEKPAGVSIDELYYERNPADVTGTVWLPPLESDEVDNDSFF